MAGQLDEFRMIVKQIFAREPKMNVNSDGASSVGTAIQASMP
jgi:hypothetical protein